MVVKHGMFFNGPSQGTLERSRHLADGAQIKAGEGVTGVSI